MPDVMRLLLVTSILVGATKADSQGPKRLPTRVIVSATATAACEWDARNRVTGSTLVRSPIVVSPDGRYQAYAENEATAYQNAGEECVNTAKLFVKGPGETEFRLVYLQEPSLYELFNEIKIVDWSPDSHYLLCNLFVGQWGSDWGGSNPLLYNVWDGVFSPPDMVGTAFSIQMGHDCSFVVEPMGFAPDGGVVLKVGPLFDPEGTQRPDSCVNKEGLWMFRDKVVPLADTYKTRRYGHVLVSKPKQ